MGRVMQLIKRGNNEIPPVSQDRALFNYYRAAYPANIPLPMSHLRSDALLGTTGEIVFNINATQAATILPTERRLSLNNTFEVLYATVKLWTWDTTRAPKLQTSLMYTYVNPFVFNSGAGVEAQNLNSIYNSGKLLYKLDNQILYPAIDCGRFERVPVSQEGQITACDAAGTVVGRILRDGYNEYQWEYGEMIPSLTLNGNGQNLFLIQLPESIDLAPDPAAKRINYASLILHGFEGIAGTQQRNRKRAVR